MGRIQVAYETKFRALLGRLNARRTEQGLGWLANEAAKLARSSELPEGQSLERIYSRLATQVNSYSHRRGYGPSEAFEPRFVCDVGLGGLARWLRAAGYETFWFPDIDDSPIVEEARRRSAILLTTDSLMMERRLLRDRIVPSVWVSPALRVSQQLAHVLRELDLPMRETRCMNCGGKLREVSREQVVDRIPPRTLRWLDEYFECQKCAKLFWHGTHWQKIRQRLSQPP